MQLLNVIFETARQVSLQRLLNVGHIRHHRADIGLFHAFVHARAHAACYHHTAIRNSGGYASVMVLRGGVKAVTARVFPVRFLVDLPAKLGMPIL